MEKYNKFIILSICSKNVPVQSKYNFYHSSTSHPLTDWHWRLLEAAAIAFNVA